MGILNVSRLDQTTLDETSHINSDVNLIALQPWKDDDLIFIDCFGETTDIDGEPDNEGPNNDGCDLENENNHNVNP